MFTPEGEDMKYLIKGGRVIDPENNLDGVLDILIEKGKIKRIAKEINDDGIRMIEAGDLTIIPGLVDAHCHLREPGYEYKEDIESGTKAAAAGGFTAVACMPNTNPIADNDSVIRYIVEKSQEKAVVKVYPIGSITKGSMGKQLSEMGMMKEMGAIAVSDDGEPVSDAGIMRKGMEYAHGFSLPIISHCEEKTLSQKGSMNEGYLSTMMGLCGIPSISEEIQVARDVLISEYTKIPVHIAHISTEGSARIIREAKKRGVQVTCETCPHYFSLTEEACVGFNTDAKVNPPLRGEKDRQAIIQALSDTTIDVIATDHAPHHQDEKKVEFEKAANGISGFETAFSAAYTYLVETEIIDLGDLVKLMVYNPSNILKIQNKGIKEGAVADITIVDLNKKDTIDPKRFLSKGKNTPFAGMTLKGTVEYTFVDGRIAYERVN